MKTWNDLKVGDTLYVYETDTVYPVTVTYGYLEGNELVVIYDSDETESDRSVWVPEHYLETSESVDSPYNEVHISIDSVVKSINTKQHKHQNMIDWLETIKIKFLEECKINS